jgi:F-type H+-transporting ATPase subunit b
MTINWWTLALQAINVLILVWLLSRLFWRPVAAAIDRRQAKTQATLEAASEAQAKADAALAEVRETRAGLAAERAALLADAQTKADAAAKAALADAQSRADALLAAAQTAIDRDTAAARKNNAAQAAGFSVEIAARLLSQLNSPMVQAAHLEVLVKAIEDMPASERKALVTGPDQIEIVSATAPTVAEKIGDQGIGHRRPGRFASVEICRRTRTDRRAGAEKRALRATQQLAGRSGRYPKGD